MRVRNNASVTRVYQLGGDFASFAGFVVTHAGQDLPERLTSWQGRLARISGRELRSRASNQAYPQAYRDACRFALTQAGW